MRRLVFLLSVIFLIITIVYIRVEYNTDYIPKIVYGDNSYMEDVVIEQKRSGSLKWRLIAKKATHVSNDEIGLEDITVLLPEKGYTLNAEKAYYNLANKSFSIPGEVVAKSDDVNIEGNKLFWDATSNSLKAESDIKIEGKGFKIQGDELTATSDRAVLNKNVRAIFNER